MPGHALRATTSGSVRLLSCGSLWSQPPLLATPLSSTRLVEFPASPRENGLALFPVPGMRRLVAASTMQKTSQEVIALLAQPIAGNPAQFVIEKALAALGLDHRYLSLEVDSADLAAAVEGARVMGFR